MLAHSQGQGTRSQAAGATTNALSSRSPHERRRLHGALCGEIPVFRGHPITAAPSMASRTWVTLAYGTQSLGARSVPKPGPSAVYYKGDEFFRCESRVLQ